MCGHVCPPDTKTNFLRPLEATPKPSGLFLENNKWIHNNILIYDYLDINGWRPWTWAKAPPNHEPEDMSHKQSNINNRPSNYFIIKSKAAGQFPPIPPSACCAQVRVVL